MALKPVVMIFGSALVASTYKDQAHCLRHRAFFPEIVQKDTTVLHHTNHWQGKDTAVLEYISITGRAGIHTICNILGIKDPEDDGLGYSILICMPQGRG